MDQPTEAELLWTCRGLMYDTATIMDDLARRMPKHSFRLYCLAIQVRLLADDISRVSATPPDAQTKDATG